MFALTVSNLKKYYGNQLVLDRVNLSVPRGKVFALLGPNGAGKTTLIKSILGITKVKEGIIKIDNIDHQLIEAHSQIAYFPEKFNFFPYYNVEGVLSFYCNMYGVPKRDIKTKINDVLNQLDIFHLRKKKISKISKGELQRTGIAATLLSEGKIFIFDEPFYGLDPIGIKKIKDIFIDLVNNGKTIFINSHILSEIEKIATEMAIINKGKILFTGNIQDKIMDDSLEDFFYSIIKGDES